MGARACMVKKSEISHTTRSRLLTANCMSIYTGRSLGDGKNYIMHMRGFYHIPPPQGVAKNDCILKPCLYRPTGTVLYPVLVQLQLHR